MSCRIEWIDISKCLGIFLVVLGHTLRNDISLVYIYGFHMPLFFFLSGIVCKPEKYSWSSFMKSRFNSLIIPYIFFYLSTWVYWIFVERSFRQIGLDWWEPLVGLIYSAQWHDYMSHNGILWFLPCLFSVEIIFYAISKIGKIKWQLIVVMLLSFIGYSIKVNLPWCINIAFISLPFFFIGHYIKDSYAFIEGFNIKRLIIAVMLFLVYYIIQFLTLNRVNMATCQYGNILLFLSAAFFGIFSFAGISKCIISRGGY